MIEELNGDFLQWLRGFYYVAKTGSVRKAAELMCRNPSTISYQLRSLENELKVQLFDRQNRVMRITQEGETLLEWAITTFETLKNMLASVSGEGEGLHGPLQMAATLPIVSLAVQPIAGFIRKYPDVKLTIRRKLADDVYKDVMESEVDFGILPVIRRPVKTHLDVVGRARPLLIFHKDFPHDIPPIPELKDLERLPTIMFESPVHQDNFNDYSQVRGLGDFIEKNAIIKVNNFHIIMRLVAQKIGVAILDELCYLGSCFGADWKDIKTITLDHIFPNRLYGILTKNDKYLSPQALALIRVLKDYFLSLPMLKEIWSPMK